jgi:5-(carboxyamino)imidazole ribonucleotide synthase
VTTLGVVGAGQLGRMLGHAAQRMGVPMRVLADGPDDPACQVCPDWVTGPLAALATDVVTFEHELVDLDEVAALERTALVRPGAQALSAVANKAAMRAAVDAVGAPAPPWAVVTTTAELDDARRRWPEHVIKLVRGGYDGRGVSVRPSADDAREWLRQGPLLVEPVVPFESELAVIVARRPGGELVTYDPVHTLQVDGQCREVRAPSGVGMQRDAEARSIAARLAAALDVVGLLAVELFVTADGLLVNELAVRPHNTGHHTIDACVTSQFENHIRAVLDLPLGPTTLHSSAVMVNVVGDRAGNDPRHHVAEALAVAPDAHIHLYGKLPRFNRKLGHVTVCDDDLDAASARAWAAVAALKGDLP